MPARPPTTDALDPGERIMAGLAKLSLVMRHEAWRAAGSRGLTPTQAQILAILGGSTTPLGVKAIAQQLAVTVGTASGAISTLVAKGLVAKETDEADGRAIVLTLTTSGRQEAEQAAKWPDAMLHAIGALPRNEQAGLLRGLVGMVRALQEQGAVPTARMCVGCRYFRPNEYPDQPKPHHCQFIDAPIGDTDLRIDCDEMEPAAAEIQPVLWNVFLNGTPLDSKGPARRHGPRAGGQPSHTPSIGDLS